MKSSDLLHCIAILGVVFVYGIYMFRTPDPADGVVMSIIIGALCALAGISYEKNKKKNIDT